jgi:hypothetical protein
MKTLNKKWHEIDRTPAHLRPVEIDILCECGARVIELKPGTEGYKKFGKFYHPAPCKIIDRRK